MSGVWSPGLFLGFRFRVVHRNCLKPENGGYTDSLSLVSGKSR